MIRFIDVSTEEIIEVPYSKKKTKLKDYHQELKSLCGCALKKIRFVDGGRKRVISPNEKINNLSYDKEGEHLWMNFKWLPSDMPVQKFIEAPLPWKKKHPLSFRVVQNKKVLGEILMLDAYKTTTFYDMYRYLCKRIPGDWNVISFRMGKDEASHELLRNEMFSTDSIHDKFLNLRIGYYPGIHQILVYVRQNLFSAVYGNNEELKTIYVEAFTGSRKDLYPLTIITGNKTWRTSITKGTTGLDLLKEAERRFKNDKNKIDFPSKVDLNQPLIGQGFGNKKPLIMHLRGGGGPRANFINAPDIENEVINKVEWSDSAPAWRVVSPGLVIEARCKNEKCITFGLKENSRVCCTLGFGKFEFTLSSPPETKCPICKKKFNIDEETCIGFSNCHITIVGETVIDGDSSISRDPQDAGNYYSFIKATKYKARTYSKLIIMTTKLDESGVPESTTCVFCNIKKKMDGWVVLTCRKKCRAHTECSKKNGNGMMCPNCISDSKQITNLAS